MNLRVFKQLVLLKGVFSKQIRSHVRAFKTGIPSLPHLGNQQMLCVCVCCPSIFFLVFIWADCITFYTIVFFDSLLKPNVIWFHLNTPENTVFLLYFEA